MSRLLHYSAAPLAEIRDRSAEQDIFFKPAGLWVSVEGKDDWPSWCRGEEFALDRLAYVHEVALHPDAAILRISSAPGFSLDWPRIAERHDGIIIAPYVWSRRLFGGASWYYSWDCASGCIWRASAIAGIKALP